MCVRVRAHARVCELVRVEVHNLFNKVFVIRLDSVQSTADSRNNFLTLCNVFLKE